MDPLRIVTKYNTRRLSETLLSSFLNYFLEPSEDHGFGYTFLARYLHLLGVLDDDRKFWSTAPTVGVEPEVSLPNNAGRIDSLVWVRQGRKLWVAATEVKIHDSSAKNQSAEGLAQLDRYFAALETMAEQGFSQIFSEDYERKEIQLEKFVFVYLVPAESKQWRKEVSEFCSRIPAAHDDSNPLKFKVLPWATGKDEQDLERFRSARILSSESLEGLIRALLEDQSVGAVPQPDDHALHLLRCIRNAALNDFRYVYPSPNSDSPFPNQEQFEAALQSSEQHEVLQAIMRAAGTERMASPRNTTIGIPVTIPKTLPSNSLLAIRTTESYANPEPLGVVELEFDCRVYSNDKLQSLVDATLLPASNVFTSQGLRIRRGTHPDANEAKADCQGKVLLLRLEKGEAFDLDRATSMLTDFVDRLRSEFFDVIRVDRDGQVTFEKRT